MVTKKINKDLNYYLNLPWTYTIEEDVDRQGNKFFIISINEFPGVQTDACTVEEAFHEIKEAMECVFKMGDKIPEPKNKV